MEAPPVPVRGRARSGSSEESGESDDLLSPLASETPWGANAPDGGEVLRSHPLSEVSVMQIKTSMQQMSSRDVGRFHLKSPWKSEHSPNARHSLKPQQTQRLSANEVESFAEVTVRDYDGCLRQLISFPGSSSRLVWDLIGAALIGYDLFNIPLRVFSPPETESVRILEWFTLVFWTLNIPASLLVGFVQDGVTVMVPRDILLNYMKSWFLIDLVVVVPDWAFTVSSMITGTESGAGSSVRLLRVLRLMRTIRLLRLLKLRMILASIIDHLDSEYANIMAHIVKMILSLLAINHFIACGWYLCANHLSADGAKTWVSEHGFEDADWSYQYATAFHWSITQFTPSSMDVQPHNLTERLFAITVVVFALVGFSYLIGSITGSLTQLRSMSEDAAKQFWVLRRFLKQHQVPPALSHRIKKYLEHKWQHQRENLSDKQVSILTLLSEQLYNELRCAMYLPHLSVHPLFLHLNSYWLATMHRLANTAISRKSLARNDTLFFPEETAREVYFLVAGRLYYTRTDSTGQLREEWVDKHEDWIAEPVLWVTEWTHLGELMAVTESELLVVDFNAFQQAVSFNPQVTALVCKYAIEFVQWLDALDVDELSDISQGECMGELLGRFIPSRPSLMKPDRLGNQNRSIFRKGVSSMMSRMTDPEPQSDMPYPFRRSQSSN